MSMTAIVTLGAAVAFAAFHVSIPVRKDGQWKAVKATGLLVPVLGIIYHTAMLPAVAVLPAPLWAMAAGFAWTLLDLVLEGASLVGTTLDVGSLREGVHLTACVWVLAAGWTGGVALGLAGTALALAFLVRLTIRALRRNPAPWIMHVNALLNVVWIVAVAIALW